MPEGGQPTEQFAAMRESLRKLDHVLNFARRLKDDQGAVPQGLVDDFADARRDLEKQFVLHFDKLDEEIRSGMRNMLQATKTPTPQLLDENLERLSRRVRGLLNRIVIEQGNTVSLTTEVGDVRFDDNLDNAPDPDEPPPPRKAVPPAQSATPAPRRMLRRVLMAAVLLLVLAGGGLGAAWAAGAFASTPVRPPVQIADNGDERLEPRDQPKRTDPQPDPTEPFNAAAAGYLLDPVAAAPGGLNPLDAEPTALTAHQFTPLMLGLEDLIAVLEPRRLHRPPERTRATLQAFGESAVAAEPEWRKSRKPLLDAFVDHIRTQAQLARYPADANAHVVLISDVLYASGGPQLPLVVTLNALAHCAGLPLLPLAPHGPELPMIGIVLEDGVHTYNGAAYGLRSDAPEVLAPDVALLHIARMLRPTLDSPEARLLCDAIVIRYGATFTPDLARRALQDLDWHWLADPEAPDAPDPDDADARRAELLHRVATMVALPVCRAMIVETVNATPEETLKLYRIARAAGDDHLAGLALELLGSRARPGTLIDGEPLSLAVGDLLLSQGRFEDADRWFTRAQTEHPDDPRPVLRRVVRARGAEAYALLREAYARGERALGFMRTLVQAAREQGQPLVALALLDELTAESAFDPEDLESAVLVCIELGRADWGLKRLAPHGDLVRSQASLLRLDLLLELSEHGMTPRARDLARAWRAREQSDPLLEGLLRRYGG